jgi:GNAT superfamily N-acetyltransferase
MDEPITVREMTQNDPQVIEKAFKDQGWNKPAGLYEDYLQESHHGKRVNLLAEVEGEFAGYVTIVWESDYPPFRKDGIPEIVDFNILVKFRRLGIGTKLMDEAERRISARSKTAGLGVCLQSDYGNAQVLYAKRGYIPDGRGAFWRENFIKYGDRVTIDDDLALYWVKKLR